jgi:signal transduction histidine kinase
MDTTRDSYEVRRGGTVIAVIAWSPDGDADRALLPDAVAVAALPIEMARLRVELRRRLEEVEASRARIAAVADDERRRVERDLHDGAQQRLVSIGLALRHAQHQLGADADEAGRTLDGAVVEIATAIEELRELARGLRPTLLQAGLGPALRELASRSPVPVEVCATTERFPLDVEAAAYFVACEGLTNAVKHARAEQVVLQVLGQDGALVVSVADDGVGGAALGRGSGLTGLSDRVAARGGRLRVVSIRGGGTTLSAELPCVS